MSNRPIIGVTVGTPYNPQKFGGTNDYSALENKPKINGVELVGDLILDDSLKFDSETKKLSVNTAVKVEEDNTKPITAGAVYTEIGNIEILLSIL